MTLKPFQACLFFVLALFACTEEVEIGKELSFFKFFGHRNEEVIYDIVPNDAGYLAIGSTTSYGASNVLTETNAKTNALIMTVDLQGNETNQVVFEQVQSTMLQRVIRVKDRYIAIGTISNQKEADLLVLFTDQFGNINNQYVFGEPEFNEVAVDLVAVEEDLFLLANQQVIDSLNQNILKSKALLIQIDLAGNEIWQRTHGIDNKLTIASTLETTRNELAFTSYSFVGSNQSVADLYLTTVGKQSSLASSVVVAKSVLPFVSPACVSTRDGTVHVAYTVANGKFNTFIAVFDGATQVLNLAVEVAHNFLVTDVFYGADDNLAVLGLETNNAVAFTGRVDIPNLLTNTLGNHLLKYDNFYNLVWANRIGGQSQVGLATIENAKQQYVIAGVGLLGQKTMAMLVKTTPQGRLTK